MDLVGYENALQSKLDTDLTESVKVESYPDDFQEYISQLKNVNGAVLIVWQGSSFEAPDANNEQQLIQDAIYNWQFTVLQQNMGPKNNQYGIYAIMEEIRTILSGFTPAGFDDCGVLFPVSAGFLERVNGFYVYQYTFGHTIPESEV